MMKMVAMKRTINFSFCWLGALLYFVGYPNLGVNGVRRFCRVITIAHKLGKTIRILIEAEILELLGSGCFLNPWISRVSKWKLQKQTKIELKVNFELWKFSNTLRNGKIEIEGRIDYQIHQSDLHNVSKYWLKFWFQSLRASELFDTQPG